MNRILFYIFFIIFLIVYFQLNISDILELPINILPYIIKVFPFIVFGVIFIIILNIKNRRNIFDIKKLKKMDTNDERTRTQDPISQQTRKYQGTPEGRQFEIDQKYKLQPRRLF